MNASHNSNLALHFLIALIATLALSCDFSSVRVSDSGPRKVQGRNTLAGAVLNASKPDDAQESKTPAPEAHIIGLLIAIIIVAGTFFYLKPVIDIKSKMTEDESVNFFLKIQNQNWWRNV